MIEKDDKRYRVNEANHKAECLYDIRLIVLIGLMSLGLMGCSGGGGDDPTGQPPTPPPTPPTPTTTEVPISFSGSESQETAVSNGGSGTVAYVANRVSRRAEGTPLSEKATVFHVWGYKNMSYNDGTGYGDAQQVFPGYRIEWHEGTAATTTTNSKGWEYVGISDQTIKYWDWGAKAYRYFAVTGWNNQAPPEAYGDFEVDKAYGTNGHDFTIAANASPKYNESVYDPDGTAAQMNATPYFSRLWFSTGNQATYPDKQFGKPVTLEFVKPYARVRFLYKYSTPREGFKLVGQSFKPSDGIKKIARKGTVTIHYPTDGTAIKESYTMSPQTGDGSGELTAFEEDYDPDNDTKVYSENAPGGWYMVLPNNQQGSYTLTVTINNSDRSVTVPAQYMQWLPGYSYTYIFKITEEGGVEIGWVEYAVVPWIEMEVNKTVFNW